MHSITPTPEPHASLQLLQNCRANTVSFPAVAHPVMSMSVPACRLCAPYRFEIDGQILPLEDMGMPLTATGKLASAPQRVDQ